MERRINYVQKIVAEQLADNRALKELLAKNTDARSEARLRTCSAAGRRVSDAPAW
jgi:hypothetical protein